MSGKFLLIYICNFHVLSNLLLNYICKLHWNLVQPQFERFIEFSDRKTYGEGMRCIFCNAFNTLPEDQTFSMVKCSNCMQQFCFRCKKPWHVGGKCPLDTENDDLESWKKGSGAQKCPTCHKLIEKDDPDTCHHMVHKITDGIPCIRDRCDFCCKFTNLNFTIVTIGFDVFHFFFFLSKSDLCGAEVLPDYPHDEVDNPGVNHFPDGVFQTCRILKQRGNFLLIYI